MNKNVTKYRSGIYDDLHNFDFGYVHKICQVEWFPKESAETPAGIYVLQHFPTGELLSQTFVEGSRSLLSRSHYSPITKSNDQLGQPMVGSAFRRYSDPIVAEWAHFSENIVSKNDDAAEYCRENGFRIPLHDVLFGNTSALSKFTQPVIKVTVLVTTTRATDSVNWSSAKECTRNNFG